MAENIQESSQQIKPSGSMSTQPSTENVNNAGAVETNVKHNRPFSAQRSGTLHWFAYIGPEDESFTARSESTEERDNRLKMLREKQNEERQRKLEELKAQALAAQRFREIKEEERRKRIEELRVRDNDRRQQVGERKRLINEAERDRRESILKKNMEREARFELKKRNERSSAAFAFGSSTPRMLEPADTGGSFWGHRRATSTNNIMFTAMPLTRRSSERELDGSKKRAISAGGLDRNNAEDMRMSTSMYEVFHWGELYSPESSGPVNRSCYSPKTNNNIPDGSSLLIPTSRSMSSHLGETIPAGCASGHVGRRRTDLMPTIPTRDLTSTPARKPFTKSPGRTYSLSRLDQLAKPRKRPVSTADLPAVLEHQQHQHKPTSSISSTATTNIKSMSRSMGHLAMAGRLTVAQGHAHVPQRPLRKADSRSMHQLSVSGLVSSESMVTAPAPVPPPRTTRAVLLRKRAIESPEGPSRPDSSLSHQSTSSISSTVNLRPRPVAAPRKPRPASIAVTGVTHDSNKNPINEKKNETKPPLPRSRKTSLGKGAPERTPSKLSKTSPKATPKATPLQSPCADAPSIPATVTTTAPASLAENTEAKLETNEKNSENPVPVESIPAPTEEKVSVKEQQSQKIEKQPEIQLEKPISKIMPKTEEIKVIPKIEEPESQIQQQSNNEEFSLDNADMTASMIAKIRITTEEEAKAALAERRRLAREEAERQAEAERLRIEAEIKAEQERQKQEEEQARLLAEQQRHAEEERLAQAIKEAQKREEEERLRREEELKQKLEKEEQEKKAREESEKQRIEMQERLKQEEKEREARRKRVEAIMLRTRASKGNSGNNQSKDESTDKVPNNDEVNNQVNNKPTIVSYEAAVNEKEAELFNGSFNKSQASVISQEISENSEPQHSNGHRNGVNTEEFSKVNKSLIEHNVTNTLLDFGELDQFKNANTNLDMSADKITNEDSVNSNNPTESNSTTDFLL